AYASAMTLLGADASEGRSYLDLAELIEHEGTSDTIEVNLEQLFRRMVFNVLVGNRDDHLCNHGFIRKGNGWVLSPAFDVNPNRYKDAHVLGVHEDNPAPSGDALVSMHKHFRMSEDNAKDLLGLIREVVRGWEAQAARSGASRSDITMMGAVIKADR
ncbi:MAG: HipA domain-containing protein, partial [Planctomycetaceae bacterium]|nr:HipA domain-containing protein [Planctomycetaceae bacterium]